MTSTFSQEEGQRRTWCGRHDVPWVEVFPAVWCPVGDYFGSEENCTVTVRLVTNTGAIEVPVSDSV